MHSALITRDKFLIEGIVQGVGFRPFVFNLSQKLKLSGFVTNTNKGVTIEVEGKVEDIERFNDLLIASPPPLAEIKSVLRENISVKGESKFSILKSNSTLGNQTFISPDVSVCKDCEAELLDSKDRRFEYPFINCTNCGPRFSITEDIPYDRPLTTMKYFEMCDKCKEEYADPQNRRFHAQPNACYNCGPNIEVHPKHQQNGVNDFYKIASLLNDGKILAIKGLGGFHLAVDASNNDAVEKLRFRKNREAKPFAVMVKDIETVKLIAELSEDEEILLKSKERPIVLLTKKPNGLVKESVAPGNKKIGVMLAYTPLHIIIFKYFEKIKNNSPAVLVMTSANLSEEPICISNNEAEKRLSGIADNLVTHNRDILIRCDDSVVNIVNNKIRMLRRSRGFVPKSIKLIHQSPSVIALGADLKNTICLTKNGNAFLSQHIGDLSNLEAYNFFDEVFNHMKKIINVNPEFAACDLHPDYMSTRYSNNFDLPIFKIQHHHAHMAACMAEYNLDEKVIGLILDGTGYGYDGTIWGGELFFANYTEIERVGHLEKINLPSGDKAAKEPWRSAIGFLYQTYGNDIPEIKHFKDLPTENILEMLDKKVNSPQCSSAGRLFDAVSALAGGPILNRFEAESAIKFMHSAESLNDYYQSDPIIDEVIPLKSIIRCVVQDVQNGLSTSEISGKFHLTFSKILCEAVSRACKIKESKKVVLSGGVFQNEILLKLVEDKLVHDGFEVYIPSLVPVNDGGVSLGQAAIASALLNQNLNSVKSE